MTDNLYLAYDYPLLGAFWTMMWIFLWILWIILLFRVIGDIFRDDSLSGWAKTGWTFFVIVLPYPESSCTSSPADVTWASAPPGTRQGPAVMTVVRSVALFVVAALFEIGGAWLVWQGIREHKGWIWIGAGVIALGLYGVVATFQSDDNFGRILAAYGGIFVAGSIAWGMAADGYRPDRWDVSAPLICLAGMAVIMYAPRSH
ncbi:hypothetical protein SALBM311S_08099 [Streptomyces alboniger]